MIHFDWYRFYMTYFDFCIFILHSEVILLLTYFLFDKVNVLQRKPSILCSGFVFVLNCKYCNTCFSIDLMVFCPLWCENGRLIFVKKLQNRWPSIPKEKAFAKNPFIKGFYKFLSPISVERELTRDQGGTWFGFTCCCWDV